MRWSKSFMIRARAITSSISRNFVPASVRHRVDAVVPRENPPTSCRVSASVNPHSRANCTTARFASASGP
jgi:hypothetical protein